MICVCAYSKEIIKGGDDCFKSITRWVDYQYQAKINILFFFFFQVKDSLNSWRERNPTWKKKQYKNMISSRRRRFFFLKGKNYDLESNILVWSVKSGTDRLWRRRIITWINTKRGWVYIVFLCRQWFAFLISSC
jgi:hypothetical protein